MAKKDKENQVKANARVSGRGKDRQLNKQTDKMKSNVHNDLIVRDTTMQRPTGHGTLN